jgi:hypothetical protein
MVLVPFAGASVALVYFDRVRREGLDLGSPPTALRCGVASPSSRRRAPSSSPG